MQKILKSLEKMGFYSYEEPSLIPVIQSLQLSLNSIWIMDGKYDKIIFPKSLSSIDSLENLDDGLYIYKPLPPHRCFSIDQEDLYEYPPMLFEDEYLSESLQKCGITINEIDEYEDSNENLHLVTNLGDFLICPSQFRSSHTHEIGLRWKVVTAKSLLMVNSLLAQAGSSERFYVLQERSEELIITVMINLPILRFFQEEIDLKNESMPKSVEQYFEPIFSHI